MHGEALPRKVRKSMPTLSEVMQKRRGTAAPPPTAAAHAAAAVEALDRDATRVVAELTGRLSEATGHAETGIALEDIATVNIEAVIGGALMRIEFTAVNPAEVAAFLRGLDPSAKFRDDFPRGGFGGNKRETKLTRCVVISADVREMGKFINLTCQNGDDITVAVSKKAAEDWLPKLEALGKLSEHNLTKLQHAFTDRKSATVILTPEEQFGVAYWTTDDGKAFLDAMQVEPPAETAEEGAAK